MIAHQLSETGKGEEHSNVVDMLSCGAQRPARFIPGFLRAVSSGLALSSGVFH